MRYVSIVHTIAYSIIAVQELNLAFKFPQIFWNTSCLIVDSAGIEDETEEEVPLVKKKEEEEIEDEEEEEEEVKKGKKTKVVKYGKISSAIGKVKTFGVKVSLPNINESYFTFRPNLKTNTIIYGIKGISRINDEYAYLIIKNRPYENFEDFLKKVKSTKLQIINLIKSGAFDCFGEDRERLLKRYICSIAGFKKKLTLQNMPTLINYNLIPEEYKKYQEIFNFNKYLKKECKQEVYYYLDEYSLNFFNKYFDLDLVQISDNGNSGLINQKAWEKIYKKEIEGIRPLINNPETLDRLNKALFLEIWNKYCSGNIAKWEMDSIGFYNKEHELNGFNFPSFNIVDFTKLPEDPVPVKNFVSKDGKTINMFDLVNICGTILEKDKLKNLVTILTDFGVVKVKIFKSQFAKYDKQIFIKDEITGKKKVIEKSWFTRGNKIIFTGLRRGDFFIPKVYKNTPYPPLTLIDITDYKKKEYNLITERAM